MSSLVGFPATLIQGEHALLDCERVAIGRCDADRGRPADGERPDRCCYVSGCAALELDLLVWKPALIEENDAADLESDDALWVEISHVHSLHQGQSQ